MSEFRQNYVTKEWVIIAPERAQRPKSPELEMKIASMKAEEWMENCPFCPGNEDKTGKEFFRIGKGARWSMRSVQNKYSALSMEADATRSVKGRFLSAGSHGHAEVIIESPLHNHALPDFDSIRMQDLLGFWRQRIAEVSTFPDIAILMLFRNHGAAAGTSLVHPHSQLIASPIIPPHIRNPIQKAMQHFDTWGSCVYCDVLNEEVRQSERVVVENEYAVAFCPYASRTPYEIRIFPTQHNASFTWVQDDEINGIAEILLASLTALFETLGNPSYNLMLHTSPIGDEDVRYLHWYIIIVPRISTPAGFEMGSGIYINPIPPEQCAQELRNKRLL